MTSTASQTGLFSTKGALIVAGLLIGGSLVLLRLTPDVITRDLARRLLGVMLGAVVVLYANAIPKVLSPLMRGDAVAAQAMRRFTVWCIALGGVGYMVAWAVAPLDRAVLIALACLGGATLLVLARILYARAGRRRT